MASDREELGTTDRDELGTDELAERAEFMRSVCGTAFDDEDFSSSRLDRGVDFSMLSTTDEDKDRVDERTAMKWQTRRRCKLQVKRLEHNSTTNPTMHHVALQ